MMYASQKSRPTPGVRVFKWVVLNVVMSLVPVIFIRYHEMIRGNYHGFESLVSHGELLLISAIISSTSIGELLSEHVALRAIKIVLILGLLYSLSISLMAYADVLSGHSSNQTLSPEVISSISVQYFIVSFILGLIGIIIKSREEIG